MPLTALDEGNCRNYKPNCDQGFAFDALLRLSLQLCICVLLFVHFYIFCTFVLLHLSTLYTGGPRTRRPSQGALFSDVLTLFDIQHFSDVPTRQCLCHVIYVPGCHEIMVKSFFSGAVRA